MKAAVINASPLIILARAGYINLLPKIFSSVAVPRAVVSEIQAGPAEAGFGNLLDGAGWLSVVDVGSFVSSLARARLGQGETEVLEYARIHPGMIAIVDDKAARRLAEGLGIPRTGTLGVLAAAAQAHYVSDFAASAAKMIGAGLYIDARTVEKLAEKLRTLGAADL